MAERSIKLKSGNKARHVQSLVAAAAPHFVSCGIKAMRARDTATSKLLAITLLLGIVTWLGTIRALAQSVKSIHEAAESGNVGLVKAFLDKGTDVNARDDKGRTPLHRAASKGREEVSELLVAKGADVNGKDDAGWTPLHAAA